MTRIFKLELEQLMSDLKDKKVLGKVLACKLCIPNALSSQVLIVSIDVLKLTILQLQIFTQLNSKRVDYHMLISCFFILPASIHPLQILIASYQLRYVSHHLRLTFILKSFIKLCLFPNLWFFL